jgi:hypothetical protein
MGYTHLRMIFTSRPIAAFPKIERSPGKKSKASALSIFTTDHEEANLVCLMKFVNPNLARIGPPETGPFQPVLFHFPTLLVLNRLISCDMS